MNCETCSIEIPTPDLKLGKTYLLKSTDKYSGNSLNEYKVVKIISTSTDVFYKFSYDGLDYGKEVKYHSWFGSKDLLKDYTIEGSFIDEDKR